VSAMLRAALLLAALLLPSACNKQEPAGPAPAGSTAAAPSGLLQPGADAPAIEAVAHDGKPIKLAELRGKPVVVYFYPKDDTPGCTIEAQGFRDEREKLEGSGAVVIGVSTDDNESHRAFADKHSLPFPLLADTDQRIAKAFGVPVTAGFAKRVTFLIDREGKIAKTFADVKPKEHAAEVLAAIAALGGG
jgi:thioredoxin-dependent peroxiredoxin